MMAARFANAQKSTSNSVNLTPGFMSPGNVSRDAACNSTQSALSLSQFVKKSKSDPFETQRLMQLLTSRGIWFKPLKLRVI
jgi:hypothetical protein